LPKDEASRSVFDVLYSIDVSEKLEKKSNDSNLLYLKWAEAWAEVKKVYPDATYEILRFGENQLPYVFDPMTGYMVFTNVTINGLTHEMWLCVMDGANKAMKAERYTYTTGRGDNKKEKVVEAASQGNHKKADNAGARLGIGLQPDNDILRRPVRSVMPRGAAPNPGVYPIWAYR
jgi:hypothetical protein